MSDPGKDIYFTSDGAIAQVWLNRPSKKNSLTLAMLEELDGFVSTIVEDESVSALVIRGVEQTFCSGYDLSHLDQDFIGSMKGLEISQRISDICARIYAARVPSVAVLEGWTLAGGLELMLACDFALAADDAKIADFHLKRSLFPGAGPLYRLPRMIGIRRTKELMLAGRVLSGSEAEQWGLVNASMPSDQLEKGIQQFLAGILASSSLAMRVTKMAIDCSLDADTSSLRVMEHFGHGLLLQSNDAREGVEAFLGKRNPVWTGS